jgi:hypothetical protein
VVRAAGAPRAEKPAGRRPRWRAVPSDWCRACLGVIRNTGENPVVLGIDQRIQSCRYWNDDPDVSQTADIAINFIFAEVVLLRSCFKTR